MISIIMLSHNAEMYTKHAIQTLNKTKKYQHFELIVLDNDSNTSTKNMLIKLKKQGLIDKLIFEETNTLFAKGNNIASKHVNADSEYILLLNSDVEIRDKYWLNILLQNHKYGATSYGTCENYPFTRGDGYCFLINKDLYDKFQLDESFEWWWSVTKLQARLLNDGHSVTSFKKHDSLIYHYGGMSGGDWENSKGMDIEGEEIKNWVESGEVNVVNNITGENPIYFKYNYINVHSRINKSSKKLNYIIKKLLQ